MFLDKSETNVFFLSPRPSLSLPGDTPSSLSFQRENIYLIRISADISEEGKIFFYKIRYYEIYEKLKFVFKRLFV